MTIVPTTIEPVVAVLQPWVMHDDYALSFSAVYVHLDQAALERIVARMNLVRSLRVSNPGLTEMAYEDATLAPVWGTDDEDMQLDALLQPQFWDNQGIIVPAAAVTRHVPDTPTADDKPYTDPDDAITPRVKAIPGLSEPDTVYDIKLLVSADEAWWRGQITDTSLVIETARLSRAALKATLTRPVCSPSALVAHTPHGTDAWVAPTLDDTYDLARVWYANERERALEQMDDDIRAHALACSPDPATAFPSQISAWFSQHDTGWGPLIAQLPPVHPPGDDTAV